MHVYVSTNPNASNATHRVFVPSVAWTTRRVFSGLNLTGSRVVKYQWGNDGVTQKPQICSRLRKWSEFDRTQKLIRDVAEPPRSLSFFHTHVHLSTQSIRYIHSVQPSSCRAVPGTLLCFRLTRPLHSSPVLCPTFTPWAGGFHPSSHNCPSQLPAPYQLVAHLRAIRYNRQTALATRCIYKLIVLLWLLRFSLLAHPLTKHVPANRASLRDDP